MCNNKKRSRASQTWVGAEVCSVNKMRPLMYKRADFSRWENDTHCIFNVSLSALSTLCLQKYYTNGFVVGAEEQQLEFQTQTSQIYSKVLASGLLLFLPKINKNQAIRTPPKCSRRTVALSSLFIHAFILHMQRLFFFMMHLIRWSRTASIVRVCPLCLLNPHLQLNSASFMRVRLIYEVANSLWLIEWQILCLSDKTALSYYLRHRVKSGMLPSFLAKYRSGFWT